MAEWGRKEYSKAWPSRRPVWAYGAFFAAVLMFAGLFVLQYEQSWTAAQKLYLLDYLKSGARGQASAKSSARYALLEGVNAKGQPQLLTGVKGGVKLGQCGGVKVGQ